MDYEQFFPKQMTSECVNERFALGMLAVLTIGYMLVDFITTCNANRKIKTLESENNTLKSIVLKSVERSLLKMMHQSEEED